MPKVSLELIGKKITDIRPATKEEKDFENWEDDFIVIEINNSILVYASIDDEGNGPGSLFGRNKASKGLEGFTLKE